MDGVDGLPGEIAENLGMAEYEKYMRQALLEAAKAESCGEVPVGAVIVQKGRIIGRGHNQPISRRDPTAHAEIMALRDAARQTGNYRLPGADMFVTLEPCLMCAGACLHARLQTLVFGARDPKTGGVRSLYQLLEDPRHNHYIDVEEGILADECRRLLQAFFQERRC